MKKETLAQRIARVIVHTVCSHIVNRNLAVIHIVLLFGKDRDDEERWLISYFPLAVIKCRGQR